MRILWWINLCSSLALVFAYLSTLISPEDIHFLCLFGLSYPIWFLINIGFCFFWLINKKRRKKAWLSAAIIFLGWNIHPTYYNTSKTQVQYSKSDIKVLSYNVRTFDRYGHLEGKKTRDKIFDLIDSEKANIMCFQEFYYTSVQNEFNTKDSIMEFCGLKNIHEKYTHHMTGGRHFGVVTMSKYPIVNKGEIPFENDDNNFCIYTDVLIDQDTIRVFNTHFASIRLAKKDYDFFDPEKDNETKVSKNLLRISSRLMATAEKRGPQADLVLDHVKKSPYPVILCGDFNDPPISYTYNIFEDELIDSFSEKGKGLQSTYIGNLPSFRIDYIFHSEEYACTSFYTRKEELSDHRAVVSTLKKLTEL